MRHGTCIHFTGLLREDDSTCKAGVNYRLAFDGSKPGLFLRMPCRQYQTLYPNGRRTYIRHGQETIREEINRRGETMISCDRYQEPTDAEIEASQKAIEAHMQKTFTALKVAGEWRVNPKPKQDRAEVIKCPICKGRLHLSQSASNGHVRGQCETADCVHWIE